MATGRDAVDVAWATRDGHAQLRTLEVWADAVPEALHLDGQTA
jgi:hypothetical protein